jgi:hypothetical protein
MIIRGHDKTFDIAARLRTAESIRDLKDFARQLIVFLDEAVEAMTPEEMIQEEKIFITGLERFDNDKDETVNLECDLSINFYRKETPVEAAAAAAKEQARLFANAKRDAELRELKLARLNSQKAQIERQIKSLG